jgi:D-sedoheptulose 7-phosphate isomerase
MPTIPEQYINELVVALLGLDTRVLERASWWLTEAYLDGQTVFVCGNGGSASTASHLATDLTKLTTPPGAQRRLKCMALTDSAATVTAIGNDLSYEDIFVEQLRSWMTSGDVVIGISTSGASKNVLRAIEYANLNGALTVGITGGQGTELRRLARETLVISSSSVQRIEDLSVVAAHLLVLLTRDNCFAALASGASEAVPQVVPAKQRNGEAA